MGQSVKSATNAIYTNINLLEFEKLLKLLKLLSKQKKFFLSEISNCLNFWKIYQSETYKIFWGFKSKKILLKIRGTNKVQIYDKKSNKKQSTKINLLLFKC